MKHSVTGSWLCDKAAHFNHSAAAINRESDSVWDRQLVAETRSWVMELEEEGIQGEYIPEET